VSRIFDSADAIDGNRCTRYQRSSWFDRGPDSSAPLEKRREDLSDGFGRERYFAGRVGHSPSSSNADLLAL
jgi:hypothetical protein